MTVPAVTLTPGTGDGPGMGVSAGQLLRLATRDDFHRWEQQLTATGNCANPIRLEGKITALDRATGQTATLYDTKAEPGGVLRIPCGNRREHVCPACAEVYKGDARQIIRAGLTGGKDVPDTVASHPCVFATLTAPSFGPVHTRRTDSRGRKLPCRPRRDVHQRRCPHGRDISCNRIHHDSDPRLGTPMCPDCYDYTGHVLFNALAPELWRRFTIYLPRHLARLLGITQKRLRSEVRVRFVKVAEYQARGIVHYHAVIRLDAASNDYQPPPAAYTTALLDDAIRHAAAAVFCDTADYIARAMLRDLPPDIRDTAPVPIVDPLLRRMLRFGTQIDVRVIRDNGPLPGTGRALSPQAVANYIAKYATKTTSAPGLPDQPIGSFDAISRLACNQHHKQIITTVWRLGCNNDAECLLLLRWTHMLGYRGHFLTKSRRYSVTFGQLRAARIDYRRAQQHPGGEHDPWGRPLDERVVLVVGTWTYAGSGHGNTAERALALSAAARARERAQIAREETHMN